MNLFTWYCWYIFGIFLGYCIYVMPWEFCISQDYFLCEKRAHSLLQIGCHVHYLLWKWKNSWSLYCIDMLTKALFIFFWITFVLNDIKITKILCQLHQSCYEHSSGIATVILSLWPLHLLGCFPEGFAISCRPEFTSSTKQQDLRAHGKRTLPGTLNFKEEILGTGFWCHCLTNFKTV